MKLNNELPKLKIETNLMDKINSAKAHLNKNSYLEVSLPAFRRMALLNFAESILAEGIEIIVDGRFKNSKEVKN